MRGMAEIGIGGGCSNGSGILTVRRIGLFAIVTSLLLLAPSVSAPATAVASSIVVSPPLTGGLDTVTGTLAAAVVVSGPSSRGPVARTGEGISLRTSAAGKGEGPLDQTGPFVAYTLVLLNNTLIPGNFLAGNGLKPTAVAYDFGMGEVFLTNYLSNTVTAISDLTTT